MGGEKRAAAISRRDFLGRTVTGSMALGLMARDSAASLQEKRVNIKFTTPLTVWHVVSPTSSTAAYNALKSISDAFSSKHKIKVTLDFVQFTTAGSFQEKVNAAAAGSNPPSIVMLSGPGKYAYTGAARPLDKYLKSSSAIKEKNWLAAEWGRCKWNGQVYGIPIGADTNALLWWNRDTFSKNGLNPDKPPTTWDELKSLTEKLLKRGPSGDIQSMGFNPTYAQGYPILYYYLTGPKHLFSQTSPPKPLFNDKYGVKALQYIVDLSDINGGGQAVTAFSQGFQSGAQDPFITGQVAMQCNGNFQEAFYQQYAPNLRYGVSTMPLPPHGVKSSTSGGFAWAIPAKVQAVEEAWKYIEFASSGENQLKLVKAWATNPTRLDLLSNPYFKSTPVKRVAIEALKNGDGRGWGEGPWYFDMFTALNVNAAENATYHKMSVKQALNQAASVTTQSINKYCVGGPSCKAIS